MFLDPDPGQLNHGGSGATTLNITHLDSMEGAVFLAGDEAELKPVPGAGLTVVALQVRPVEEYPAQARLRSLAPATQPHNRQGFHPCTK